MFTVSELCVACGKPIVWIYREWSRNPNAGEWTHEVVPTATDPHQAQGPRWCGPGGMTALQCKAIDICDCFDFPEEEKALAAMSDEEVFAIGDAVMGEGRL